MNDKQAAATPATAKLARPQTAVPAKAPTPASSPRRERPRAAAKAKTNVKSYFPNEGMHYVKFMTALMDEFKVQSYFEIGTSTGKSLAPVKCKSVAVDPAFALTQPSVGSKEFCMFFQLSSDAFFAKYNLSSLLGGPFDVAFLDGLHVYEYLLRDFMNAEKHGRRNSVVFLHDCLPQYFGITTRRQEQRQRNVPGWTGDVWKVVPILRKYRPDLVIHLLDCHPTGLVMITNLDPASEVLDKKYFDIVAEFAQGPKDEAQFAEFHSTAKPVATKGMIHLTDFAKLCWL